MNNSNQRSQWMQRAFLIAVADVLSVLAAYFAALVLRFDLRPWNIPEQYLAGYCWSMPYWEEHR